MRQDLFLQQWGLHGYAVKADVDSGFSTQIPPPDSFSLLLNGFCCLSADKRFFLYATKDDVILQVGSRLWYLGNPELRLGLRRRLLKPSMRRFSIKSLAGVELIHDYPSEFLPGLRDPTYDLIDADRDFFFYLVDHYRSERWIENAKRYWGAGFRMTKQ